MVDAKSEKIMRGSEGAYVTRRTEKWIKEESRVAPTGNESEGFGRAGKARRGSVFRSPATETAASGGAAPGARDLLPGQSPGGSVFRQSGANGESKYDKKGHSIDYNPLFYGYWNGKTNEYIQYGTRFKDLPSPYNKYFLQVNHFLYLWSVLRLDNSLVI